MTCGESESRNANRVPPDEAAGPLERGPGETAGLRAAMGGDGAALDTESETEVWTGRPHWKHHAGRLALWVVANIVVATGIGWVASRVDWLGGRGAAMTIVGVILISGVLVVGRVILAILGRRYRLTSQRLFIERGILSQTIDQTELIRVDDVRIHKSFLDRLFGLGSVAILSTDASDRAIVIEGIANAEYVAEVIRKRMRTMRRKSLFVENL